MKTLNELMLQYGSDKSTINHNYCPGYELWFEPLRNEPLHFLELGIGGDNTQTGGGSLKAWIDYFPNAKIGGVDIYNKDFLKEYHPRLNIYEGSQDNATFLQEVVKDLGGLDIVVDDASHISSLTIASFEILFPLLSSGGLYCIEDLSCCFRWDFEGTRRLKSLEDKTTLNVFFEIIQDMCYPEYGIPNYKKLERNIESIYIYPELLILKKK